MTTRFSKQLELLSNGEIPEQFDFSVEGYLKKKSVMPYMTYKTYTEEFVYNYFDPVLLQMFPGLLDLAKEEYEANKQRTPLQEMNERIKQSEIQSKLKSADILYEC